MNRRSTGPARAASESRLPGTLACLAIAVTAPALLLLLWHLSGSNYVIDDAFISYRYAQHLAGGLGLTWNPGSAPTQGFSNPLFVVLVAALMSLGTPPLLAAHVLNAVGLSAICAVVYLLSVHLLQSRWAALLPALAVAAFPDSLRNAMSGLETVFWTALLFVLAAVVARQVTSGGKIHPGPPLVLAFLATLTRAESAGLAGLWLAYLFVRRARPGRLRLVRWGLASAFVGIGYLCWCRWYFGDALPNSYYVKVNDPLTVPGAAYVAAYVRRMALVALCAALCFWPRRLTVTEGREVASYSVLLALPVLFLFVNPIVGTYYRFFYPATCLVLTLGVIGTIRWVRNARERALPGHSLNRPVRAIVTAIPCLLAAAVLCIQPVRVTIQQQLHPARNRPFDVELRVARSLSQIDGISDVVIAINDAGVIPFVTGAHVLDYVGLNDSRIARHGWQRGASWVMDLILSDAPDLFVTYTYPDGEVLVGDGVLGPHRGQLLSSERFREGYEYLGGCDLGDVQQQWFLRRDSMYGVALRGALSGLIDVRSYRRE
jgi:arabinofuranosyltransferase